MQSMNTHKWTICILREVAKNISRGVSRIYITGQVSLPIGIEGVITDLSLPDPDLSLESEFSSGSGSN